MAPFSSDERPDECSDECPDEQRLADWQAAAQAQMPAGWVATVAQMTGLSAPVWGAQLLWNRGWRSPESLLGFLKAENYKPTSPSAFGEEMAWAVERLVVARDRAEKVAIWGDFDADGVTSTAVLWDGLRQFFIGENQLTYFIPNRLKESHGLSMLGINQLAEQGVKLIVTCDTGSTNPTEIDQARSLGMDIIVTDHHTLPEIRPAVVAIVNPRALPPDHPLAHLSGVAVAYKLIEALYERLPAVPVRPLSELVDLVAIGLIADLVELTGDCRYLAQIGIDQLQTHLQRDQPVRPGVAKLLQLCRRAGDRPTDISFGIGPRINAVSRIYGDARFCVELLTSEDPDRCRELAEKAELANVRRKALQNDVLQQAIQQLQTQDLSTLGVIVLCNSQWPVGVLGLVAGQLAQQYAKPTILLTVDSPGAADNGAAGNEDVLARGSARSVNHIDLYDLVNSQAHLLKRFGGHPFAAGLSLPLNDLPMFTAAINQQYRQKMGDRPSSPTAQFDLTVTVADLGAALFQQLKLLEPCGMGNPVPQLLIQNCWFESVGHQKLTDRTGSKVGYIKASFQICDDSGARFPGLWWGHYKDDLPPGRWDVIAELDYNSHPKSRCYEIRLIAIREAISQPFIAEPFTDPKQPDLKQTDSGLLDFRWAQSANQTAANQANKKAAKTTLILRECPTQWTELRLWQHQADQTRQPLALAYAEPVAIDPLQQWKTLLGLAKYISREQIAVTPEQLSAKLGVCDRTLTLGLAALAEAGFNVTTSAIDIRLTMAEPTAHSSADKSFQNAALSRFLAAIQEEYFRRQYFYQAPLATLQSVMKQTLLPATAKPDRE